MQKLIFIAVALVIITLTSCRNNSPSPEERAEAKRAGAIQITEDTASKKTDISDTAQTESKPRTMDMRSETALKSRIEAIYREVLTNHSRSYMVQKPSVNHISPAPKNVEYFTSRFAREAEQLPCTTCDEYSVWEGEFQGSGTGTTRLAAIDSTRISGDSALVFITLIASPQSDKQTRIIRLLFQRENWFVDGFR